MMTNSELQEYLKKHPDYRLCPNCGGAGELPLPIRGKVVECQVCRGGQVVRREE